METRLIWMPEMISSRSTPESAKAWRRVLPNILPRPSSSSFQVSSQTKKQRLRFFNEQLRQILSTLPSQSSPRFSRRLASSIPSASSVSPPSMSSAPQPSLLKSWTTSPSRQQSLSPLSVATLASPSSLSSLNPSHRFPRASLRRTLKHSPTAFSTVVTRSSRPKTAPVVLPSAWPRLATSSPT